MGFSVMGGIRQVLRALEWAWHFAEISGRGTLLKPGRGTLLKYTCAVQEVQESCVRSSGINAKSQ